MRFISTRGGDVAKNAAEAIVNGLAKDGGLYVPERFPSFKDALAEMVDEDYPTRAVRVLSAFLEEYDREKLYAACCKAYGQFEEGEPAPVVKMDDGYYVMELFHGPTLAFKDVALTLLPYLLREGCNLCGIDDTVLILVATSGDTGKAALEGFKNADGIKIMVFYPGEGVSEMQKRQMSVQEGENVSVLAVEGNFDDCQSAVKRIFSDKEAIRLLKEKNYILSSANSINFGRLCPQIVYYFSAYCDLVGAGEIELGDKVNFVVPTGNFGNILAGWYAKKMGLPIGKLICASNANNILTDFFASGKYDLHRPFFKTTSPSMDILISSNLERLVFECANRDAELTAARMKELAEKKQYTLSARENALLTKEFYANFAGEKEVSETIGNFFEEYDYPLDPHTAVAVAVHNGYVCETGDSKPTVILSTASPYKFPESVLHAMDVSFSGDGFDAAEKLEEETAVPIPMQITRLKTLPIRFAAKAEPNALLKEVLAFIER